jgi:hypothetical protein
VERVKAPAMIIIKEKIEVFLVKKTEKRIVKDVIRKWELRL